ncbi:lytic transglycosylase domain-containing protein [Nocardioides ferulae]|uniref:lytic transglycosylase domain-containing protein n=1 Tax=Nocardioides ferulae TaxID=2340821 RepID=UPI001F0C6FE0|nr:lytic murein transglycosylase [Nocardioides ferulae]
MGATSAVASQQQPADPAMPDGTTVPTQAIEAPASVSSPGVVADGPNAKKAAQIVRTSSTNGIPSAALAAYQRAETVINAADKTCNLSWQLVAAIGRVESDHGRFDGNSLDADGVAKPGIYGIALNGKRGTATIRDTDAGQVDDDTTFDRAVGPMQFIPSTWSVVGVDADGDGKRNPQDIDDAALASAVYLCSGDDDLSTSAGQRAAVFRYNHSTSYVDLVLSIMEAYLDGDFTSVPNSTTSAGYFVPDPDYTAEAGDQPGQGNGGNQGSNVSTNGPGDGGGEQPPPADPTSPPSQQPEPEPEPDEPKGPLPSIPVTVPPLPSTSIEPVDEVLSFAQAVLQCTLDGYVDNILKKDDPFDKCVEGYMNP